MSKRALVFAVVLCLLATPAFAGLLDRSFIKPHGGVVATTGQFEQFDVAGYFNLGFVFPLYTPGGFNVYGDGSYSDVNNEEQNWETFTGKVNVYAKEPTSQEMNFYGFAGGSVIHSQAWEEKLGKAAFNGGFGVIWPILGTKPLFEVGVIQVENSTTVTLTLGLMIGADPKQ